MLATNVDENGLSQHVSKLYLIIVDARKYRFGILSKQSQIAGVIEQVMQDVCGIWLSDIVGLYSTCFGF